MPRLWGGVTSGGGAKALVRDCDDSKVKEGPRTAGVFYERQISCTVYYRVFNLRRGLCRDNPSSSDYASMAWHGNEKESTPRPRLFGVIHKLSNDGDDSVGIIAVEQTDSDISEALRFFQEWPRFSQQAVLSTTVPT